MQSPYLQLLAQLDAHDDRVWYVSWSADGNTLASCSSDRTVRLWDCTPLVAQQQQKQQENTQDNGSNDSLIAVQCVSVINEGDSVHSRTIRSVEWSPDMQLLACASFDGTTSIWSRTAHDVDMESASETKSSCSQWMCVSTLEGHENEVKSVSWDASGQLLATSARDRTVWIWEVLDRGTEFDCVSVLNGHTQDVKMVKWHPTREILASASYDDTVRMWCEDTDDWFPADILRHHKSTVWAIDFNQDGTRLVSASSDLDVVIWQMHESRSQSSALSSGVYIPNEKPFEWRPICVIGGKHKRDVYGVDWNKVCGDLIATASGDDALRIFRLKERTETVSSFKQEASPSAEQMDIEDDTAIVSSQSDETSELGFEQVICLEKAHDSDLNCVRWHPKLGNILATCSDDHTIKIWRLVE